MEESPKEHEAGVASSIQFIRSVVWEFATAVLPALLIALCINVFAAEASVVDGPSMQPNLYRGYRVVAEKVSYRFHPPHRGDVVIVDRPGNQGSLIKRVVALPGETVEVRGGHVLINGQRIEEPWVSNFGGPNYPPRVVPADHVFILGDNRVNSRDSRVIGPVPVELIKGHVRLIYWPLDEIKVVP